MIIRESTHQGSEAWDEWRSTRATASEFDKIFTGGGKVSAQRDSYMRLKAIQRKYKRRAWAGNAATDRGHELEPISRNLWAELSGREVREVACIEHDNDLCGGSPDGIISHRGVDISGYETKAYNYDKHIGMIDRGVFPTACKPQVHGALWLTGFSSWIFMIYHPDAMPFDYKVWEVSPDQYTQDLGGEVLSFCEELDRRADEFIDDFEKSMSGVSMKEAMPILEAQIARMDEEARMDEDIISSPPMSPATTSLEIEFPLIDQWLEIKK